MLFKKAWNFPGFFIFTDVIKGKIVKLNVRDGSCDFLISAKSDSVP